MPSYVKKILSFFEKSTIGYYFKIDKKIFLHRQDLALILGVSTQSIKNYEAKGLKALQDSPSRTPMYDFHYALDWYKSNVNTKFRPNKQPSMTTPQTQKTENLDRFLDTLPIYKREIFHLSELDYMDRLLKLRDTEKKETANRKELGELIDINDVDRAMASLAGVMMGSYVHYEDESSAELAGCDATQIAEKMRKAHYEIFEELHQIINKEFRAGQEFYDVMALVYKHLSSGSTIDDIKNRLDNV